MSRVNLDQKLTIFPTLRAPALIFSQLRDKQNCETHFLIELPSVKSLLISIDCSHQTNHYFAQVKKQIFELHWSISVL